MNINEHNQLVCDTCGEIMHPEKMDGHNLIWSTLVGYHSPPGHDHNDNCQTLNYFCKNKHRHQVSVKRVCPVKDCDWKGKEECFCHKGKKLEKWPI